MVTELIRPVNYNPGRSQKLIKLEMSSCRCSQLECNEESDETEGYSALYTPLLSAVLKFSGWSLATVKIIRRDQWHDLAYKQHGHCADKSCQLFPRYFLESQSN